MLQQTQQRCHNRELEILAPIVLRPKNRIRASPPPAKNSSDVTKHEMYFRVIKTFLNSQKNKVLRRAAPVNVTRSLADIFVCQSLPDFRFSSRLIFMCQSPPPWHISALGSGPWWEGGENDFTQIQFLASISNFLSLTKWKFQQRSPEGWSGWVKYAPTPLWPPARCWWLVYCGGSVFWTKPVSHH